jgi:hypothetical protein
MPPVYLGHYIQKLGTGVSLSVLLKFKAKRDSLHKFHTHCSFILQYSKYMVTVTDWREETFAWSADKKGVKPEGPGIGIK